MKMLVPVLQSAQTSFTHRFIRAAGPESTISSTKYVVDTFCIHIQGLAQEKQTKKWTGKIRYYELLTQIQY